jgi:hypothetical protein
MPKCAILQLWRLQQKTNKKNNCRGAHRTILNDKHGFRNRLKIIRSNYQRGFFGARWTGLLQWVRDTRLLECMSLLRTVNVNLERVESDYSACMARVEVATFRLQAYPFFLQAGCNHKLPMVGIYHLTSSRVTNVVRRLGCLLHHRECRDWSWARSGKGLAITHSKTVRSSGSPGKCCA